jgi:anthranilate/para-aminobenzoate synthase component II
VQFHPESLLTPTGNRLMQNFLKMTSVVPKQVAPV